MFDSDFYFKCALKLVIERNQASVSYLQRKLSIGYSRAARFIDEMEEKGFISAPSENGRKVFITKEQFEEYFGDMSEFDFKNCDENPEFEEPSEYLLNEITKGIAGFENSDDEENSLRKGDEIFKQAVKFAIKRKNTSVSALQKEFSIGYSRAALIIDKMEMLGYIDPPMERKKTRKTLITPEQFRKDFGEEHNS